MPAMQRPARFMAANAYSIHSPTCSYILVRGVHCEAPLSVDLIASMHIDRSGVRMNETHGINETDRMLVTPSRLRVVSYDLPVGFMHCDRTYLPAEMNVAPPAIRARFRGLNKSPANCGLVNLLTKVRESTMRGHRAHCPTRLGQYFKV